MTELHQEANSKETSSQEINNSETVEQIEKTDQTPVEKYSAGKVQFGLVLTVVGFVLFLLGIRPDFFGADRSPVIGFVQIATFTIGLAVICVGGYSSLAGLWGKRELSLLADIGPRLVATGFVICVFSGMADVFGFGSHLLPDTVPYFGQWQAAGVQVGEFFIALGFLLLIPFHRFRRK